MVSLNDDVEKTRAQQIQCMQEGEAWSVTVRCNLYRVVTIKKIHQGSGQISVNMSKKQPWKDSFEQQSKLFLAR